MTGDIDCTVVGAGPSAASAPSAQTQFCAGNMDPSPPMLDDELSFNSYCIVCDRYIVPVKPVEASEEEAVSAPAKPKKRAGGTIRVSHPR